MDVRRPFQLSGWERRFECNGSVVSFSARLSKSISPVRFLLLMDDFFCAFGRAESSSHPQGEFEWVHFVDCWDHPAEFDSLDVPENMPQYFVQFIGISECRTSPFRDVIRVREIRNKLWAAFRSFRQQFHKAEVGKTRFADAAKTLAHSQFFCRKETQNLNVKMERIIRWSRPLWFLFEIAREEINPHSPYTSINLIVACSRERMLNSLLWCRKSGIPPRPSQQQDFLHRLITRGLLGFSLLFLSDNQCRLHRNPSAPFPSISLAKMLKTRSLESTFILSLVGWVSMLAIWTGHSWTTLDTHSQALNECLVSPEIFHFFVQEKSMGCSEKPVG